MILSLIVHLLSNFLSLGWYNADKNSCKLDFVNFKPSFYRQEKKF